MLREGLGSILVTLLLVNNIHEVHCSIAAAAGGAAYALGGAGGGGGHCGVKCQQMREDEEAFIMLLMASGIGGSIIVMIFYGIRKLYRRYVLKIREPPGNNFQLDKKVKCRAGEYQLNE